MWTSLLKTAQDWLAKSIPAQLAIVAAAAVLLFAPDHVVNAMGLTPFRDQNRATIGVTLLVVGALLVAESATGVAVWIKKHVLWRFELRRLRLQLHNLTPAERFALRGYLAEDTRTQYFIPQDGVVQGLVHAKILYRSTNLGNLVQGFGYNIQPWAWDYLRLHPELLGE